MKYRPLKNQKFDKQYTCKSEQEFAEKAREHGWKVTKCGWPDFICYGDTDVMFVEVKARSSQRFKKAEVKLMGVLSDYGIKIYKWSPDKDWLTNNLVK